MGGYIRTPRQFLNVSNGKLMNKKENVYLDGYVGRLKSIEFKVETFEGQENAKWKIVMVDTQSAEGAEAMIGFKADAYFGLGFFSRIQKINLREPFLLGVYHPKDKSEKLSLCYMKQGGQKVESEKDLVPMPESVKVGTKEVLNWEPSLKKCHEIAAIINGALATIGDIPIAAASQDAPEPQPESDLPF